MTQDGQGHSYVRDARYQLVHIPPTPTQWLLEIEYAVSVLPVGTTR
jgi:hypothetical protein